MAEPHLSRNAPCWCGSGRKYKKCCLEADRLARGDPDRARLPRARDYGEILHDILKPQTRSHEVGPERR